MMLRHKFSMLAATGLLVLAAGGGQAEDIDIYYGSGGGSTDPAGEPIVMFSLDWRPNLASTYSCGPECQFLIDDGYLSATGPYTFFDILRAALKKVMDPLEGVKVGLMMSHDFKNSCQGKVVAGCSNGGFMALGAKSFMANDANGAKAAFHAYLEAVPLPQGNQSHPYQGAELFFEMYRYFTGQAIYNGHVGYLDFKTPGATNMDVDTPQTMWDTSIESGTNYISPLKDGGRCTKTFTVNMLFQVSQQEADSNNEIKKPVASGGLGINPGTSETFENVVDWLNDVDLADGAHGTPSNLEGTQNVTSYFIVDPTKINTKTTGYAQAGGTGVPLPLSDDPEELVRTLSDIFRQILSVSTTFVAASIPVNVFNRAEIVDNIFIALFQPDENVAPYWVGNVKKLKVAGLDTGTPSLVDANGDPAVAADGRVRFEALTLWTDPATLPPATPDTEEVDGKDGRVVDRGGAGQQIKGFVSGSPGVTNADGARRLYYDASSSSLGDLDADSATATTLQAALGAGSVAEAEALIGWARGLDVDDLDADGDTTDPRAWIFGDPLHSRPLPINFGAQPGYSKANPAIYIAVGSNDGFLRMIRNTATGGGESGEEVWGFMPQSVMGKLSTLRTNSAGVRHPYLLDGAPVAYLQDANADGTINGGEKAWLFIGMRRGGKGLYALDVSDPESPDLMWSIQKGGDFAELGYTFSDPRVILVPTPSGDRPALIFGGGYDTNKDLRAGVGTNDTEGNAIFVVDAETGDLIWKAVGGAGAPGSQVFYHADLVDSIPSTVSILDSDGDGLQDRAYVGDTGGNVWRVDLVGTDTSDWKLTLLASLGRHAPGAGSKEDDLRFFHRPDIVQSSDKDGAFDAVVFGSGDRADPKDAGGEVVNWAVMIKDRGVKPGTGTDTGLDRFDLGDVTNTCLQDGQACTADLTNGWALQLQAEGEKSLATPLTIANVVYITTYLPAGGSPEGSCGPEEGSGRLYAVSLLDASARNNYDSTTEDLERFTELDSKGIPAEVVSLPPKSVLRPDLKIEPTNASTRFLTYWYEGEDGDL